MARGIFEKTEELAAKLLQLIDLPLFDDSKRLEVSNVSCSMSLEHWGATLNLLENGLLPSAVVVHRSQFEALLRSIWVLYAASDEHLSKLSAVLTVESEQNAKNLPQVADMMAALSKKGPPQAFDALNRFKDNSWKALNSYVHAGVHPIRRHAEGYPMQLLESIAKNSNGLAIVSAMQVAVLGGAQPLQREILNLASQYAGCMPPPL
jgi:Ni,Fe-hydrogenase III component G